MDDCIVVGAGGCASDGENIYFNQGARIEKFDGQVVSVSSPVGGVFDAASPPGGWAPVDLQDGASWRVDYMGVGAEKIRYQLDATAMGSETVRVDGVDTDARQILYTGWMYAQGRSDSAASLAVPGERALLREHGACRQVRCGVPAWYRQHLSGKPRTGARVALSQRPANLGL